MRRSAAVGTVLGLAAMALGLTSCGVFGPEVTDCDTSVMPAVCGGNERFRLGGARVAVTDLTIDIGSDGSLVKAGVAIEHPPSSGSVQLHLGDDDPDQVVLDPLDAGCLASGASQCELVWDIAGSGYEGASLNDVPPDVYLVFTDAATEVVVWLVQFTAGQPG